MEVLIMNEDEIIGNVIQIADESTLIVNVGRDFLDIGSQIRVIEKGPELKNLDGSTLCNYCFIKDTLVVTEITELYAVCQKLEDSKSSGLAFALSPLLVSQKKTIAPLNVNKEEIKPLTINDAQIHVGDPICLA